MSQDREIRGAQIKPAAPRYTVDEQPLMVVSRTLGSPVAYQLSGANISKSGVLLETRGKGRIPFNVNTLLELEIDPSSHLLQRPIQCVGKVIRLASGRDGQPQFGIKIVQIDAPEHDVWDACFRHLEEHARHLLIPDKRLLQLESNAGDRAN
ncbi:MAG: hypothetical protein RIQ81_1595 [Pseudomonadota bacterium]|jgi:hypothetical protein